MEDCAYNLKRLKLQVRTSSVTPIKSVVVVSSEVKLQKLCPVNAGHVCTEMCLKQSQAPTC